MAEESLGRKATLFYVLASFCRVDCWVKVGAQDPVCYLHMVYSLLAQAALWLWKVDVLCLGEALTWGKVL